MSENGDAYDTDDDEGCGYSYDHKTVEDECDGLIVWTCTECGAEGFEESASGDAQGIA